MVSGVARERIPATAVGLSLLGLVPLAAALYLQLTGASGLSLAIIHGGLLLAFLGGACWGAAIKGWARRLPLELTAGAAAAMVALAAALLPEIPGLCLLIAGFLTQALWDEMSSGAGSWPGKLRMVLTAGAASALTVMLVIVLI